MKEYQENPEMYQLVAKNIRKYRKEKNLSIEELSLYTNIKRSILEKIEEDENVVISIYELYKISVILEVGINHFFE